jgi:hypothetical protein
LFVHVLNLKSAPQVQEKVVQTFKRLAGIFMG